ncbi:molecular chaperone DnaJ [Candidatus Woesearchaeota archaeon]|nr:MAG: molecular chaperone DnaJ [Candidatus Woesearchaeota archaeon]
MALLKVKGHEFELHPAKDSFSRRALQSKNAIINSLRKLGIPEHQVEIKLEGAPFRTAPATAEWYLDGHRLYFRYEAAGKFADNLLVIAHVIEREVNLVLSDKKPLDEFISEFREENDVEEQRKLARETLGLAHDEKDIGTINTRYKELAREHHPDKPTGNAEKFKEVNKAHKILKRELE